MAQGNLFNHVPNDEEGKLFVALLRKYANRDTIKVIKPRGRGSRKEATGYMKDLRLDQAERLHIYFDYQDEYDNEHKVWKLQSELETMKTALQFFFTKAQGCRQVLDNLIQDLDTFQDLSSTFREFTQDTWKLYSLKRGLKSISNCTKENNHE